MIFLRGLESLRVAWQPPIGPERRRVVKAAVMRAVGAPLAIEDIQLGAPGPREVVVRTVATGVCHSDLHVLEGALADAAADRPRARARGRGRGGRRATSDTSRPATT